MLKVLPLIAGFPCSPCYSFPMQTAGSKVKGRSELKSIVERHQARGQRVVFTNGCFDLLHIGHVRYLEKAQAVGDALIVAVNSDASVLRLKGAGRPVVTQKDRCEVLGGLASVDYVTVFDEATPLEIIRELAPDVLVKGGDWDLDQIVGRSFVEESGGRVTSIEFEKGYSTTAIIDHIRNAATEPLAEKS